MKTLKSVFLITFLTSLFACRNNVKPDALANPPYTVIPTPPRQKTAAELREELKQKEQADPLGYLSVANAYMNENITQKADLFHHTRKDGWILSGAIANNATIARFKDAVLVVRFFSETNTEILSQEFFIYKYFTPGAVSSFEYKLYPPEGFRNFTTTLRAATAID